VAVSRNRTASRRRTASDRPEVALVRKEKTPPPRDSGAGGPECRRRGQTPRPLDGAARAMASPQRDAYTGSGLRCKAIGTDRRWSRDTAHTPTKPPGLTRLGDNTPCRIQSSTYRGLTQRLT
jgi:hypothetical protein